MIYYRIHSYANKLLGNCALVFNSYVLLSLYALTKIPRKTGQFLWQLLRPEMIVCCKIRLCGRRYYTSIFGLQIW